MARRRSVLDDVNTIEAYAKEMRDFLKHSELTERKAFIQSFVKEIVVIRAMPSPDTPCLCQAIA